jgi:hypothetical protein
LVFPAAAPEQQQEKGMALLVFPGKPRAAAKAAVAEPTLCIPLPGYGSASFPWKTKGCCKGLIKRKKPKNCRLCNYKVAFYRCSSYYWNPKLFMQRINISGYRELSTSKIKEMIRF